MQKLSEFAPTGFDPKGVGPDEYQDWLVVVGQNRDSGHLAQSNFTAALSELGGDGPNVALLNFGHWACGWFELIVVRPDTPEATRAQELRDALEDYPVLDDEDYSRREWEDYEEYWDSYEYIRGLGVSEEISSVLGEMGRDVLRTELFEPSINSGEYYLHSGEDLYPNYGEAQRGTTRTAIAEFILRQKYPFLLK